MTGIRDPIRAPLLGNSSRQLPFASFSTGDLGMRLIPIVILALSVAGCSQPAAPPATTNQEVGHDHSHKDDHQDGHEHSHDAPLTKADAKLPATLAELVSRVKGYRDEIETAIAAEKPETAHRAFEELTIVLDETMTLAQDAVPAERLAAVNAARQTIRNAFLEIHQTIDAKEKLDYPAKKPAIEAAIWTLEESAGTPPPK
jgi:hypothetical protein